MGEKRKVEVPKELPPVIQLANGYLFKLAVLLIHHRDQNGRPKLVTILHDDDLIDIAGGEDFQVVYLPQHPSEVKKQGS